jgi:hypothetical protein
MRQCFSYIFDFSKTQQRWNYTDEIEMNECKQDDCYYCNRFSMGFFMDRIIAKYDKEVYVCHEERIPIEKFIDEHKRTSNFYIY